MTIIETEYDLVYSCVTTVPNIQPNCCLLQRAVEKVSHTGIHVILTRWTLLIPYCRLGKHTQHRCDGNVIVTGCR